MYRTKMRKKVKYFWTRLYIQHWQGDAMATIYYFSVYCPFTIPAHDLVF